MSRIYPTAIATIPLGEIEINVIDRNNITSISRNIVLRNIGYNAEVYLEYVGGAFVEVRFAATVNRTEFGKPTSGSAHRTIVDETVTRVNEFILTAAGRELIEEGDYQAKVRSIQAAKEQVTKVRRECLVKESELQEVIETMDAMQFIRYKQGLGEKLTVKELSLIQAVAAA